MASSGTRTEFIALGVLAAIVFGFVWLASTSNSSSSEPETPLETGRNLLLDLIGNDSDLCIEICRWLAGKSLAYQEILNEAINALKPDEYDEPT
jgi:hypothetical protein